eukprot:734358-Heterocapsa_arctica.AAC.1
MKEQLDSMMNIVTTIHVMFQKWNMSDLTQVVQDKAGEVGTEKAAEQGDTGGMKPQIEPKEVTLSPQMEKDIQDITDYWRWDTTGAWKTNISKKQ